MLLSLLLCFTTLFNILGHQRRFRHRTWKVWQIMLRGCNFGLRLFYVPETYDTGFTSLPKEVHTQDFYALRKSIDPGPGSYPRTSDPEASMRTAEPPGSTLLALRQTSYLIIATKLVVPSCLLQVWSVLLGGELFLPSFPAYYSGRINLYILLPVAEIFKDWRPDINKAVSAKSKQLRWKDSYTVI